MNFDKLFEHEPDLRFSTDEIEEGDKRVRMYVDSHSYVSGEMIQDIADVLDAEKWELSYHPEGDEYDRFVAITFTVDEGDGPDGEEE